MPLLHWLTREEDIKRASRAPYRLLEEIPELSYGDQTSTNMLIQGDNLDALKAILPYYAGKIKCIFIDPPYNTKSAFEHYDDNLEHSQWLAMMYPRLELLRQFLREDGSIWVTIDDNEGHYLKVVMDEIFGRDNFISSVVWVKTSSVHNNADFFSSMNDVMHVFAKNILQCKFGRVARSLRNSSDYSNPDGDPRGDWSSSPLHVSLTSGQRGAQYAKTGKSSGLFPIISPHGDEIWPPRGRCWGYSPETIELLQKDRRIWWGLDGKNQPRIKRFLSEIKDGVVPTTVWEHKEVGHNQEAKKEMVDLLDRGVNELFATPKPERLLERVMQIATCPGDYVLDSFLGSGTTAAVAHKMARQYIGIEMGEHAETHCAPRLRKVIDGEQGGISKSVGWKGGGGVRFYRLGDAVFDEAGHVSPRIRFAALAAHLWFAETGQPLIEQKEGPFLGEHEGSGYYLLYNGVLGDKRPDGGNVLTSRILALLPPFDGPKVIFGEGCRMGAERLAKERITFRHIPYEIKAR